MKFVTVIREIYTPQTNLIARVVDAESQEAARAALDADIARFAEETTESTIDVVAVLPLEG